ncbi:MAG: universal stress protein [Dehalococcoidales bacterium]
MYRRMLVLLDGSELAEMALIYARELAGRLDIDLTLLHVSSPAARATVPMQRAYVQHAAEIMQKEARIVQKKTGLKPKGRLVKVRGELVEGYPAEEILHYAEENDIDLILMATHGRSGARRWSMGSVAGKILNASRIPVWLVQTRAHEEIPYDKWPDKTILVPLDGSNLAESVLPHVEAIAGQRNTEQMEVVLLRISEPPAIPTYYGTDITGASIDWGSYTQQETVRRKKSAENYLAEIEKKLKESKINVTAKVIEGKAKDEIVDYANKHPHSLIIMASHGRSGLSRLVYGSVAANLLHGVSNPIFLIKPQLIDTKQD